MNYIDMLKKELCSVKIQLIDLEEGFECLSFFDRKCRTKEMNSLYQRKRQIQEELSLDYFLVREPDAVK